MTNLLFERVQVIAPIDILYAAMWRQISIARCCDPATALTVFERNERAGCMDEERTSFLHRTFSSSVDMLVSQPLVSIAMWIRHSLEEVRSDPCFEGWLVDSLQIRESSANSSPAEELIALSIDSTETEHLIQSRSIGGGSVVQRSSMEDRFLPECGHAKSRVMSMDIVLAGFNSFPGIADLSSRVFCIRAASFDAAGCKKAGFPDWAQSYVEGESAEMCRDFFSIDIWLPAVELDRFKKLYGDSSFVTDDFFGN